METVSSLSHSQVCAGNTGRVQGSCCPVQPVLPPGYAFLCSGPERHSVHLGLDPGPLKLELSWPGVPGAALGEKWGHPRNIRDCLPPGVPSMSVILGQQAPLGLGAESASRWGPTETLCRERCQGGCWRVVALFLGMVWLEPLQKASPGCEGPSPGTLGQGGMRGLVFSI